MYFEECQLHSKVLGRSMNFNVYGHAGRPILVFLHLVAVITNMVILG